MGRFTRNIIQWNQNDIKSSQSTNGDYYTEYRIIPVFRSNCILDRSFFLFPVDESNSDFVDDDDEEYGEELNEEEGDVLMQTDSETEGEEESYSTEEDFKPERRKRRGKTKAKTKKVSCPTCNQKFKSQESFLTHMSNVHLKIADFQCW